jgi:hypothetical protein
MGQTSNSPNAPSGSNLRNEYVKYRSSPDVFQRIELFENLVALDFFGHVYGHYGVGTQTTIKTTTTTTTTTTAR